MISNKQYLAMNLLSTVVNVVICILYMQFEETCEDSKTLWIYYDNLTNIVKLFQFLLDDWGRKTQA